MSTAIAKSSLGSIEGATNPLLFFLVKTTRRTLSSFNIQAQNASSARRKMWGEDGNDARFIKLNRW